MIIVVEGPSAAGKTTWCTQHAPRWLPEPGRWSLDEVLRYQRQRWRDAVEADASGEVIVLDGDPFKLYYSWAQRKLGIATEEEWLAEVSRTRQQFSEGSYGISDLVLFADPGADELARRREADTTRRRRNFALHTAMRPYFRTWYEAVACLDPSRVIWHHPTTGLSEPTLNLGSRRDRSNVDLFDELLAQVSR